MENTCSCSCTCNCSNCKPSYQDKWRFTLYTTIMALVLFSPFLYSLMQLILGPIVTISKKGCPTIIGFLIHLLVFTLVLRYSMDIDIKKMM